MLTSSRILITAVSVAVAFLGASCSDDDAPESAGSTTTGGAAVAVGPQNYTVVVDGPSTLGAENLVFGTYFPKSVAVRPGDTVTFDNRSSNDIHTVTFGVKSDRSNQPPPELGNGQANPAAFAPCYTTEPARPDLTCPPPTAGAPEYTGQGYWNSGVIFPTALPPEAGPKQATVVVKAGQTVKWRGISPYMPHTVSFEPPFKSPAEPDALLPAGVKSGGAYGGGVSHSGIFGPPPGYPVDTFSLKFTTAGQYPYLCLLHPGMAGTVQVT